MNVHSVNPVHQHPTPPVTTQNTTQTGQHTQNVQQKPPPANTAASSVGLGHHVDTHA